MKLIIAADEEVCSQRAAEIVANAVSAKPDVVLGLATGNTFVDVYARLAADREINKLDWSKVTTFNLDEYVGLEQDDPNSYFSFMQKHLFSKVGTSPERTHVPSGLKTAPADLKRYETEIKKAGGIDLQMLGLGRNGHIGFNEPGSKFDTRTRVVALHPTTIVANTPMFSSSDHVPRQAVTMGIATILEAKKIVLVAAGENKADAVKALFQGEESFDFPCTALRHHPNVTVIVDTKAARELKLSLWSRIVRHATFRF